MTGVRIRKKRLRRLGWEVVSDEPGEDGSRHRLELRSPNGKSVEVEARSRNRAYRQAERIAEEGSS